MRQNSFVLLSTRILFQSTHPLRGATKKRRWPSGSLIFQSTRPLRGATFSRLSSFSLSVFQSTRPLRGATGCEHGRDGDALISIHAPLAGCDLLLRAGKRDALRISIHAPLAGCDKSLQIWLGQSWDFNPRAPCGVRLLAAHQSKKRRLFQSTRPLRGATRG